MDYSTLSYCELATDNSPTMRRVLEYYRDNYLAEEKSAARATAQLIGLSIPEDQPSDLYVLMCICTAALLFREDDLEGIVNDERYERRFDRLLEPRGKRLLCLTDPAAVRQSMRLVGGELDVLLFSR